MKHLKVAQIEVKTNEAGMYCLNDLHKASGAERKHAPSDWLRSEAVKDLEQEILNTGKCGIKTTAGRYGGTFVCKEMVYAYAMWISPRFNLEVIDVFDKTNKAKSDIESIAENVKIARKSLTSQINKASVNIAELKGHGSSWGSYGAAIRRAKRETVKEFEKLKDEIQLKLDLIS